MTPGSPRCAWLRATQIAVMRTFCSFRGFLLQTSLAACIAVCDTCNVVPARYIVIHERCNAILMSCNAIDERCNVILVSYNSIDECCNAIREWHNVILMSCNTIHERCSVIRDRYIVIFPACDVISQRRIGIHSAGSVVLSVNNVISHLAAHGVYSALGRAPRVVVDNTKRRAVGVERTAHAAQCVGGVPRGRAAVQGGQAVQAVHVPGGCRAADLGLDLIDVGLFDCPFEELWLRSR
jgi:hypothetical protein